MVSKLGMGKAQEEQRKAVAAGYWDLYRYNPQLKEEGKIHSPWIPKNQLKTSKTSLKVEVRYASLSKAAPDVCRRIVR